MVPALGRWRLLILLLCLVLLFAAPARAQAAQLVNGQQFTRGLAVIDAPAPNSQHNAPGNMPIAIDVSGNGKLQTLGDDSRFILLDLFLISEEVGVNVTVSTGPALLAGEPGSTVKHLDFQIPSCLPAGNYNLTFYEASMFQGQSVYAITTVSLKLASKAAAGDDANFSCISPPPTVPEAQPQAQSPLAFAPFAPDAPPLTTASASSSAPPPAASSSKPATSSNAPAQTPAPSSGWVQQSEDPSSPVTASASPGGFFVPFAASAAASAVPPTSLLQTLLATTLVIGACTIRPWTLVM